MSAVHVISVSQQNRHQWRHKPSLALCPPKINSRADLEGKKGKSHLGVCVCVLLSPLLTCGGGVEENVSLWKNKEPWFSPHPAFCLCDREVFPFHPAERFCISHITFYANCAYRTNCTATLRELQLWCMDFSEAETSGTLLHSLEQTILRCFLSIHISQKGKNIPFCSETFYANCWNSDQSHSCHSCTEHNTGSYIVFQMYAFVCTYFKYVHYLYMFLHYLYMF